MKASVTIGALSLCCWGLGAIFCTQMANWGVVAILAAGLFLWLGAGSTVMCIACSLVDLARGLKKWGS